MHLCYTWHVKYSTYLLTYGKRCQNYEASMMKLRRWYASLSGIIYRSWTKLSIQFNSYLYSAITVRQHSCSALWSRWTICKFISWFMQIQSPKRAAISKGTSFPRPPIGINGLWLWRLDYTGGLQSPRLPDLALPPLSSLPNPKYATLMVDPVEYFLRWFP